MEQILSSEWLRGTPLPKAADDLADWVTLPTRVNGTTSVAAGVNGDPDGASGGGSAGALGGLSDIEVAARERLAALGIGAALLHEHIEKGVRSPVIGTYRIAVNRLQKQASSQPPTPDANPSAAASAMHAVSVGSYPLASPATIYNNPCCGDCLMDYVAPQDSNGRGCAGCATPGAGSEDGAAGRHSLRGNSTGPSPGIGRGLLFRKAKSAKAAAPKQDANGHGQAHGRTPVRSRTCVIL